VIKLVGELSFLRQVIDFVHCIVDYHASFTKQSLSSTLEKSLAVATTWDAFGAW
jgi:hypothetical protein